MPEYTKIIEDMERFISMDVLSYEEADVYSVVDDVGADLDKDY